LEKFYNVSALSKSNFVEKQIKKFKNIDKKTIEKNETCAIELLENQEVGIVLKIMKIKKKNFTSNKGRFMFFLSNRCKINISKIYYF
jgi:hypothetical protein